MLFALPVPVTTVLLIVNRTLYIVSMRSAISTLATCNITPSNVQRPIYEGDWSITVYITSGVVYHFL